MGSAAAGWAVAGWAAVGWAVGSAAGVVQEYSSPTAVPIGLLALLVQETRTPRLRAHTDSRSQVHREQTTSMMHLRFQT